MKLPVQYSIIRFMPYVETEEFVNIGIVAFSPLTGDFNFRIAQGATRVNQFFPKIERQLYRIVLQNLRAELERVKGVIKSIPPGSMFREDSNFAGNIYDSLIRKRETMLRYSDDRVVLADSFEGKLDELLDFYAFHSFAIPPSQEQKMEHELRKILQGTDARYVERDIGDGDLPVKIPFTRVVDGKVVQAIKPLNLDQASAAKVFEHGGLWVDKLRRLHRRNTIPERMMLAISQPMQGEVTRAYKEIVGDLSELPVIIVPFEETRKIRAFAEAIH